MKHTARIFSVALFFGFFLSVLCAFAQGTITGSVTDRETGKPLPGANVFLRGTVIGAVTNDEGLFVIRNVPAQSMTLVVTMLGYERFSREDIFVPAGETSSFEISIRPTVVVTTPVVITATKTERSLTDVPTSVTVMQAGEIERRGIFSIDEALRSLPGVHFNMSQINIRGSSGYSHGAGTRVMLMLDGVPLLAGDTGEITWELVPVGAVERIEVVKGAGSTLYGSGALGGVVNIITRDLPVEGSGTSVRLQGGMYDKPGPEEWRWAAGTRYKHQMHAAHARRIGNLQIGGSLGTIYDGGYRLNDTNRRISGYLKSRYLISPYSSLTFSGLFIDQNRRNFLYWDSLDKALIPSESRMGESVKSFRSQAALQYRHILGSESFLTARGSWYFTDWSDNIDVSGNASKSSVLGVEAQFHHAVNPAHFLTTGIEASFQHVESDLFGKRSGHVLAIYIQDEWNLSAPLRLSGGVRFDLSRLDTLSLFTSASPRVGAVYNINPRTALRFSAGAGFRAPSAAEAFATTAVSGIIVEANPDLDAERSRSFEAGINADLSSWMNIDAAAYLNEYKDMIEPVAVADPAAGEIRARFVNVVRARVQGFEAGVTMSFLNRAVQPRLAYTLADSRDKDLNEPLKYRHRHMFSGSLLLTSGPFWFETDYRYMSRVEKIDPELNLVVEDADKRVAVHVVDAGAGMRGVLGGIPVRLSVNVKNLLQYYYVEFVANVQPIRQFTMSVEAGI